MSTNDTHSNTYAGEDEFDSSEGKENAADSNESLSLEELNKILGKNFKDKTTALKSLKDTENYASKNAQEKKELEDKLKTATTDSDRIKQIETDLFYTNNPQYKPYRETIEAMGGNPAETVEKDAFKKLFTNLSAYEKTKSAKSVLESNPRIGQAKTRIDEAKDLSAHGRQADANAAATQAVLEAYEK